MEVNDDGLYLGPCLPVATDETEWTEEQQQQFAAEWVRQGQQRGKIRLLTPLPRRVRIRLAATRAIDGAAIWLAWHRCPLAARALWRAFGMMRR